MEGLGGVLPWHEIAEPSVATLVQECLSTEYALHRFCCLTQDNVRLDCCSVMNSFNATSAVEARWLCRNLYYAPMPLGGLAVKGVFVFFLFTIVAGSGKRKDESHRGHVTHIELLMIFYQIVTSVLALIAINEHAPTKDSTWQSQDAQALTMALSAGTLTLVTTIVQLCLRYFEERAPLFRCDIWRVIADRERLTQIFNDSDTASNWPAAHHVMWTTDECRSAAAR